MSQRTTTLERLRQPVAGYGLPARAVVAIVTALLGNLAIVNLAISADLAPDLMALSYPPVVLLTVVGVLGATVVYRLLESRVDAPTRTFTRLAWAVLVLSFLPDIGILLADDTATAAGVGALAFMHLTTAVACIAFVPSGE
ncbi:DUF6069 family protein [Haloarchaeobius iranensis]|uniref:Uncharacterized protein n=1 Tax=Haloarchaeobius iranensis TaxID=996166 RepID=A0A1G9YV03_9EURY|nr:DUF6069 family protein [Haloarchaeobius iranensis]SDN13008.1 hypothetical protein SAMN05192554_11652 [Haloarchaeobius iranensis]